MCSQNALGVIHYITPQKFFPSLLYFFVPRAVLNRNLLCDAVLTNENWHIQLLKFIAGVPESFTWWREEHRSPSFYCMMRGSGRRHWGWALWSICGPEPLTTTTTTLSAVRSVIREEECRNPAQRCRSCIHGLQTSANNLSNQSELVFIPWDNYSFVYHSCNNWLFISF